MIDRLLARLKDTQPPVDLAREALALVPPAIAAQLFPGPLIPAAVLVGLVARATGWEVLLTRRTEHLRDHPGQISFPGGRLNDPHESAVAAALREAREEVGIEAPFIEVIGFLRPHAVVTGYAVSPVVAVLRPGFSLVADAAEVAEIFAVPLRYLEDPANVIHSERVVRGVTVPVRAYQYGPHHIWGATAQILGALLDNDHERQK